MTPRTSNNANRLDPQHVKNILLGTTKLARSLARVAIRRAMKLVEEDQSNPEYEWQAQVQATGMLVSSCTLVDGSVYDYNEMLAARRYLAEHKGADPQDVIANDFRAQLKRAWRPGTAYLNILQGVTAWQEAFRTQLMVPIEFEDVVIPKLNHVAVSELIERTDRLDHPAIAKAEEIRHAGENEATQDAFHMASWLIRFIIDSPPPIATRTDI